MKRPNEAHALVAEYCRLDEAGARLPPRNTALHRRIMALVSWNFEPTWNDYVVIRGYRLSAPSGGGGRTTIFVDYEVLGKIAKGHYTATPGRQRQRFEVIDEAGELFIYRPIEPPHVGRAAARRLAE